MASSALIGALRVTLGLDSAAFEQGADKTERRLDRLERAGFKAGRAIRSLSAMAAGLGVMLAGVFTGRVVQNALDYASSLGEVAAQLGVTAEELQVYRYAASQVNLTQEEMDKSLAKLTLSIGKAASGAKAEGNAFKALGVDLKDSNGNVRSTGDVMLDVAESISRIEDPAKRATAVYAIFGRQGQKLIPLLEGGASGLREFARQAEDAGAVIADGDIAKADETADKIAALNQQLQVRLASTVAQNAGAIGALANSVADLANASLKFLGSNPQQTLALIGAIGGALAGARAGGVGGAAIGGVAGGLGGLALGRNMANQSNDLALRTRELRSATANVQQLRGLGGFASSPNNPAWKKAQANLAEQRKLMDRALAQHNAANASTPAAAGAGFDPGEFLAGGGGGGGKGGGGPKGKSAAELARETAEAAARFEDEMGRVRVDRLQAEAEYSQSIKQRRDAEIAAVDEDMASYERGLALDDERSQAQKDMLLEEQRALTGQRRRNIEQEYAAALVSEEAELARGALQLQIADAALRSEMADNSRDRLAAELELFDLNERLRDAELDRILATEAIASAAWQNARAEKDRIQATRDTRRSAAADANATPAQRYADSLRLSSGQLSEAFDDIKMRGLDMFNDGLTEAIVNFRSLGSVAKSIIKQILGDLLQLQIRQAIIAPLANALGLGGSGSILPQLAGARAAGGPVLGNRPYLIGERGPEIFMPGQAGTVLPNEVLSAAGRGGDTYNIHVNGAMSDRDARRTGNQIAMAAQQRQAAARKAGLAG